MASSVQLRERVSTTTPIRPTNGAGTPTSTAVATARVDRFDGRDGQALLAFVSPPSLGATGSGSAQAPSRQSDLPPPIRSGLQPIQVATTSSLINIDGYGAGLGNRLIPMPTGTGRMASADQARQALLNAYGLANPTPLQRQALDELNLFGGTERVPAWVMPSGTFLPVNITPEMDNHLRGIGGLRQHAANAQQSARSVVEQGGYFPDRTALWQQLVGSGVSQDSARQLLARNDQNASGYLTRVASDVLDPNGTTYYNNLSQTLPPLVSGGYLSQDRAQQLMDRNLLRSYAARLQGDRSRWPTPREVNDAGYAILQRGNATLQEIEALKQQAHGEVPDITQAPRGGRRRSAAVWSGRSTRPPTCSTCWAWCLLSARRRTRPTSR